MLNEVLSKENGIILKFKGECRTLGIEINRECGYLYALKRNPGSPTIKEIISVFGSWKEFLKSLGKDASVQGIRWGITNDELKKLVHIEKERTGAEISIDYAIKRDPFIAPTLQLISKRGIDLTDIFRRPKDINELLSIGSYIKEEEKKDKQEFTEVTAEPVEKVIENSKKTITEIIKGKTVSDDDLYSLENFAKMTSLNKMTVIRLVSEEKIIPSYNSKGEMFFTKEQYKKIIKSKTDDKSLHLKTNLYKIENFANKLGLSLDELRFIEKSGEIVPLLVDTNGEKYYAPEQEEDIMEFIQRENAKAAEIYNTIKNNVAPEVEEVEETIEVAPEVEEVEETIEVAPEVEEVEETIEVEPSSKVFKEVVYINVDLEDIREEMSMYPNEFVFFDQDGKRILEGIKNKQFERLVMSKNSKFTFGQIKEIIDLAEEFGIEIK